MNDSTALWWVIKGPVVGSIMVSILGIKREGRDRQREYREGKDKLCHSCIICCNTGAHIIKLF